MNFKSDNPNDNINIAKCILENAGIFDYQYVGYSSSNGVSVYFKNSNDLKIRVSDHTVTNIHRIYNELHLSFDKKLWGFGGKITFKDCTEKNITMAKIFGYN